MLEKTGFVSKRTHCRMLNPFFPNAAEKGDYTNSIKQDEADKKQQRSGRAAVGQRNTAQKDKKTQA